MERKGRKVTKSEKGGEGKGDEAPIEISGYAAASWIGFKKLELKVL